ncbi:hypothetical protein MNEG_5340 [Monoraphidium neglectum]|uniref:Uncharacterized protein n=1 Tax=Monoraphidium neglectum TaxID=145388 RepID=A0A0D2L6V2_9CHLO|nr:hypothetical protein MNEG_5340 [Monoraphidium neglectum]KIZ02614.1 hypothetical protein MNEG_5340 [Monoraphidium neglectum]|eukprot:XP_013901633.1 hypothetical protein MNEG_5340 [Monoraphidium neglectum]
MPHAGAASGQALVARERSGADYPAHGFLAAEASAGAASAAASFGPELSSGALASVAAAAARGGPQGAALGVLLQRMQSEQAALRADLARQAATLDTIAAGRRAAVEQRDAAWEELRHARGAMGLASPQQQRQQQQQHHHHHSHSHHSHQHGSGSAGLLGEPSAANSCGAQQLSAWREEEEWGPEGGQLRASGSCLDGGGRCTDSRQFVVESFLVGGCARHAGAIMLALALAAGPMLRSSARLLAFLKVYGTLRDEIVDDELFAGQPADAKAWLREMLDYNVPGGKLNRGMAVYDVLAAMKGPENLSVEDIFQANALGWCIELVRIGCW